MKYEDIRSDMIAAMKAHDKPREEAISGVIEAIKKVAIGLAQPTAMDSSARILTGFTTRTNCWRRICINKTEDRNNCEGFQVGSLFSV